MGRLVIPTGARSAEWRDLFCRCIDKKGPDQHHPDERLVIVVNSARPSAVGRELFVARSAFINATRAAAKGL